MLIWIRGRYAITILGIWHASRCLVALSTNPLLPPSNASYRMPVIVSSAFFYGSDVHTKAVATDMSSGCWHATGVARITLRAKPAYVLEVARLSYKVERHRAWAGLCASIGVSFRRVVHADPRAVNFETGWVSGWAYTMYNQRWAKLDMSAIMSISE